MDIGKLQSFCTTYETRSFTRAADQLFFTRQAISKAVKNIEIEWGVTLFVRSKDGLIPTQEADAACPIAKQIVSLYDDLRTSIDMPPGHEPVSVALANGVINSIPDAFPEFSRLHPDIKVNLSIMGAAECEALVLAGQHEMGLGIGPIESANLKSVTLKKERVYLIGLKSILADDGSIPEGTKLLLMGTQFKPDKILLEHMGSSAEKFNIEMGFSNYDIVVEMVKAGIGICAGAESYLRMFEGADVFANPIRYEDYGWSIELITVANRTLSPNAQVLYDFLAELSSKDAKD